MGLEETNSQKVIGSFNNYTFIVEKYQRGYKWEKQQVEDLLNDIKEFSEEGNYCLQPIVVKKREEENMYELIDGQQRITTIYIILSYLNICKDQIDNFGFNIEYNTRKESKDFLTKCIANKEYPLTEYDKWEDFTKEHSEFDNVDNYHFFTAYRVIADWFKGRESEKEEFKKNLLENVSVLWYEPENEKEVSIIFRDVNSGKIPLTNAELIKAEILIDKNLEEENRAQIAHEWDEMEAALQHDEWWCSLKPKNPYTNRIELLFMLLAEQKAKIDKDEKKDKYALFRFIQKEKKTNPSLSIWDRIKKIYYTLEEWQQDDEMFHFVGFILNTKLSTIPALLEKWDGKDNTKLKFLNSIKKQVTDKICNNKENLNQEIENLNYEKDNSNDKIKRVLLLHNILSLRYKGADKKYKYQSRFRFDLYNKENWSLEHIHARNEITDVDYKRMIADIKSTISYYSKIKSWSEEDKIKYHYLSNVTETIINSNEKQKETFREEYKEFDSYIKTKENSDDKIHGIGNMALLSGSINSSIGNGYFDEKRNKIIEFDEMGKYILPATKNVFLKYHTIEIDNVYSWTTSDQENYKKSITKKIINLIEEIKTSEEEN